jgi:hypothetical protein
MTYLRPRRVVPPIFSVESASMTSSTSVRVQCHGMTPMCSWMRHRPLVDGDEHYPFLLYRGLYGLVATYRNIRSRQAMALRNPFHAQRYRTFGNQNLPVRLHCLPLCSIFQILCCNKLYRSLPYFKQSMYVTACPILVKRAGKCR